MSSVKWLPSTRSGNPISVLTTELNSLTTTGSAITASAIDNDMWLAQERPDLAAQSLEAAAPLPLTLGGRHPKVQAFH